MSQNQHAESEFVTADNVVLYRQDWLPPQPRGHMVLIHGVGEHSGRYHEWAACWNAEGIALHAIDLRGHGKSPGQRGHVPSYETLLDDICAFVTCVYKETGAKPFLYGHSLGGGLVINAGFRSPPVRGVIASAPALRTQPQSPMKLALGRMMKRIWPGFSMENGLKEADICHVPLDEGRLSSIGDTLCHSRISATLGIEMIDAGEMALARAGEFPVPLLIVHGWNDKITLARASESFAKTAQAAGRNVEFIGYDGWYHEIHRERGREKLLADCLQWMEKLS